MPADSRGALGKLGEDLACDELGRRGYIILERRYRTRFGELDIIARDGGVLVFVEVRTRSSRRFGTPFESVTWQKRHRISRMAASYLSARGLANVRCRFDVAAVTPDASGALQVDIVRA